MTTLTALALEMTGGGWLRRWRRSPLLPVQLFLAIGIGMGTLAALVSLLVPLGYRPMPLREPARLVQVWEKVDAGGPVMAISGPDFSELSDGTRSVFTSFGAFMERSDLWLRDSRGAVKVPTCYIQARIFSDLGIRPVLGRGVRPDDEPAVKGGSAPVWISYRLWQSRYGGSPSVIGAPLALATSAEGRTDGQLYIAGVLPQGAGLPLPFETESAADLWYLAERDLAGRPRENTVFFGVGRLRPNVTVAQAQSALAVIARGLEQRYQADWRRRPVVQDLESIAQAPTRQTMGLLVLGVSLVFLAGCVNLAILMGAEGRRRRREIAIRAARGASPRRLWFEVAAEQSLLTLLSLGAGVVIARFLLRLFSRLLPAAGLGPPLMAPPPLDHTLLLGFAVLALALALVWSVLLVSASDGRRGAGLLAAIGNTPAQTGSGDSDRGSGRWRVLLLALQACLGVCLLAAAALTTGSYLRHTEVNLGPDPRQTLVLSVSARENASVSDAQAAEFRLQLLSRLQNLPGTEAVALAEVFPPPGFPTRFRREGDSGMAERVASTPVSVTPGYFRALGIPILFGRGFDGTDHPGGEPVAVISLGMARGNWEHPAQAIGARISLGAKPENRLRIVGVAADFTGYWSDRPVPTIYRPEAQSGDWCGQAILRTSASLRTVAPLLPGIVQALPVPVNLAEVSTLHDRWRSTLTRPLARMYGMVLLALLALALCVQGVYALAAGIVVARRQEIAVRSALGASSPRLVWEMARAMVLSVLLGAAIGAAAVVAIGPLLGQLAGATPVGEVPAILGAIVLLGLAATAGCYLPARATVRSQPIDALREG